MYTIKFHFEYVDPYLSIVSTNKDLDEIIDKAKALCDVFDFEFDLQNASVDDLPHIKFSIAFSCMDYNKQHYINVLNAFASEYQILIAASFREKEIIDLI